MTGLTARRAPWSEALTRMQASPLALLRRSVYALPLAMAAALVVVVINETGYERSAEAVTMLVERGDTRAQIQSMLRGLLDAETGQRGYLLTSRASYLEPYQAGVASAEAALTELKRLYAGDAQKRAQLQAVETKAREKLSELATTLELHQQDKHDQWRELLMSDIGKEKMQEVRAAALALRDAETERIQRQRNEVELTLWLSRVGVHGMAALSLLALLLFLRNTRALDRAQLELAQAQSAERDRLEHEVARRTAELTELARHLETAREDERSRLARELHDELGSLLTAAKLDAARLRRSVAALSPAAEDGLKHLNATLDRGITLKRNIIENLRPSSLSNLGLVTALEIQTREFAQRSEVRVQTQLEAVRLSDDAQTTVYRLVQEALTNAAKYARANEVTVTLTNDGGRAHVTVSDNGVGFDPGAVRRNAHGLTGMRYRVEGHGGSMQITASPGEGTTISAWLPTLPS
jgi:signal transduction histidine kinase